MRSDFLQREASLVFYIISCGRVLGLYTHNNIVHNILYSYICNIATIYLKYNIVYRDLQAHRQSRLSCGRVGIARPSHRPLSIYRGASICIYYVINAHNNTRLGIKERKNEFFIIPYFPVCCPFCTYIDIFIISVFVPRCVHAPRITGAVLKRRIVIPTTHSYYILLLL